MKTFTLLIGLLLSCFIHAQNSPNLFQHIVHDFEIKPIDENYIPANSPYIVGKINFDILHSDKIMFNDLNGDLVTIIHSRNERQGNAEVWIGKKENSLFGDSHLSVVNKTLWGKIESDNGTLLLMRPLLSNPDLVVLYQSLTNEDEDCVDENTLVIDTPPDSSADTYNDVDGDTTNVCDPNAACFENNLDLLVVYTTQAKNDLGGTTAAAEAAIALAVAEMNTINFNSGNLTKTFSAVAPQEITYAESNDLGTDLDRLRTDQDGFMDDVLDMRDEFYADVVSLVVSGGGCGLGNVNVDSVQYESQAAFSVSSDACLVNNKTLAHEVGHNLGFRHDRYAYSSTPTIVCNSAWGWINPNGFGGNDNQKWRTVMAYNNECDDAGFNCFRISNWSNPNVDFNGDPTGSALGNFDEADNSDILNRAFCQVEDFRVAPNCTDCEIIKTCEPYNITTNLGPGNTTVFNIDTSDATISNNLGDAQVCVYYYGDHNNDQEQFNVIDENANILGTTVASLDCDIPNRVCFTIPISTFNSWMADDVVTITLDPISSSINPSLCSANRACVELINPTVLSTEDFSVSNEDVKIYPNPAKDILNISSNYEIIAINIYDLSGKIVAKNKYKNSIDVSELASGVYFSKIYIGNTVVNKKFVIQ